MNAPKSLFGHALGAAGAIESVAAVLQLVHGFIHPSRNCEDLHRDLAWCEPRIARTRIERPLRVVAKASFGFGDVNSCILFRKFEELRTKAMNTESLNLTATLEGIVRRFAPRDRASIVLTPATRLIEDAGIDSPRMIDVVLEVEDQFGVTLDDEAAQRIRTFGEMQTVVASLAGVEM